MSKQYYLGMFCFGCYIGMFQDFMGKEAYIAFTQNHWTNAPWWIWLIPFIAASYWSHKLEKAETNN